LVDEINADNIESRVIDSDYTVDYIVPETGAQVLLPLREKIQVLVEELFPETEPLLEGPTPEEIEAAQTVQSQARAAEIEQQAQRQQEIKNFLAQEKAGLVVQNGTTRSNLASKTALYLKQQGFNITQFGSADSEGYANTVIVVYDEGKIYTLEVLRAIFQVAEENVRSSPNLKSDVDFRVIIGDDFELSNNNAQPILPLGNED
jgi:hypothetical protein